MCPLLSPSASGEGGGVAGGAAGGAAEGSSGVVLSQARPEIPIRERMALSLRERRSEAAVRPKVAGEGHGDADAENSGRRAARSARPRLEIMARGGQPHAFCV